MNWEDLSAGVRTDLYLTRPASHSAIVGSSAKYLQMDLREFAKTEVPDSVSDEWREPFLASTPSRDSGQIDRRLYLLPAVQQMQRPFRLEQACFVTHVLG
jgi:hypothetical protein